MISSAISISFFSNTQFSDVQIVPRRQATWCLTVQPLVHATKERSAWVTLEIAATSWANACE